MIEFDGVTKEYSPGTETAHMALKGLTFSVAPGQICCLLGPNGAGKTTAINLLLGFLPVTSGEIRVAGVPVTGGGEAARRKIAYIPDDVALYGDLTGHENMAFFSELSGTVKTSEELIAIAGRFELDRTRLARRVRSYSKGMKQRLAICIALLKEASVYILDEPTTGLDAIGIRELLSLLKLLRDENKTVLVTTHDLLHVAGFATNVVFLNRGEIQASLAGDEIGKRNLEDVYIEHCRT